MVDVHDTDRALVPTCRFLVEGQSPDGTWRSNRYGIFKNGDALTPLVAHALLITGGTRSAPSVHRAAAYLAAMARLDGTIDEGPYGLSYPVHTAALTVQVLSPLAAHRHARDAWLSFLRERQLTEALGWHPSDEDYGGWGYAHALPRKPTPDEPAGLLTEANLAATVLALEALQAASCTMKDPAILKARCYLARCQNCADDPACHDPTFDDGGFFYIHRDATRNKAGTAGIDRAGRPRYVSYGSATADGLRGLRAAGLPREDLHVLGACRWLEQNFSATCQPGNFASDRHLLRDSAYYYYAASVARALRGMSGASVGWAEALADELLRRQRPDGSWSNDAVEMREDEPLVATAQAMVALVASWPPVSGQPGCPSLPFQPRAQRPEEPSTEQSAPQSSTAASSASRKPSRAVAAVTPALTDDATAINALSTSSPMPAVRAFSIRLRVQT